jgi:hypothetical protein
MPIKILSNGKKIFVWSDDDIKFLKNNYPQKGKEWCTKKLGALREHPVRYKAAQLELRLNGDSELRLNAIEKRRKTITGRKRPDQALVMKKLWENI